MATTELAIIFPLVIGLILMVVQGVLWAHAGAVAQAAADHGAEVASLLGSNDALAVEAAKDFARNSDVLRDVAVVANNPSGSEFVSVQVTGRYPSVFGTRTISVSGTSIREQVPDP